MIVKMTCKCGNIDPRKAVEYHGLLGYEAVVCACCGRYADDLAEYEADSWSRDIAGLNG